MVDINVAGVTASGSKSSRGLATRFGEFRNVRDFGAVGDGAAHPLSSKYATLAAAQVDYPRATSLTESLEWHAHQLAIDTVGAAGGGSIYTPAGNYVMMPCPGALTFPLCRDGANTTITTTQVSVNWLGDGDESTFLRWNSDMGGSPNAAYAVMCGLEAGDPINQQSDSRYGATSAATSVGIFQDLCWIGPSLTLLPANTVGATGCNMSGLCWASRRRMNRVRIAGFYAGIDLVGDHTSLKRVGIEYCYYGVYHNAKSPSLFGDLTIDDKFAISNCRMACMGFHYAAQMGTWHVRGRPFFGLSPFGMFKEATPGSPTFTPIANFLAGIQWDTPFFEQLGNAVIWDDNIRATGATNASTLDQCSFKHATFPGWNDTFRLAGYDRCIVLVGNMNGCRFEQVTKWEATGCTRPLFDVVGTMFGESYISGDVEALITSATAAGVQVYHANPSAGGSGYAVNDLITLAGGTPYNANTRAVVQVSAVSGGAVTAFVVISNGLYSVAPSSPAAQLSTTGAGTGATVAINTGAPMLFRGSTDLNVKRMTAEHTHGNGAVGCYKGRFYQVYNAVAVTAGHACTEQFFGVHPAHDTDTTPFLGFARTTTPTGLSNVQVMTTLVAEEGEDIPFFSVGPSAIQTLHKLTSTGGSVSQAQNSADGRIVGYKASTGMSVYKGGRAAPLLNHRIRNVEISSGAAYTMVANDAGKIKRLSGTALQISGAGVTAGGSGYAVNDTVTLAGGTLASGGVAAVLVVKAVSSGAITQVAVQTPGTYTTVPTNPASQSATSGAGTGATFSLVSQAAPLAVTLLNTALAGFEVELWQSYNGPITWATSGTIVNAAGNITSTDGLNTSVIATVVNYGVVAAAIVAGGSGYNVNDTITLAGGTLGLNATAAVLTVTSVSSGAVTGVSLTSVGNYFVGPTGTVAQGSTSGSGTGFTCTVTLGNEWFIRPSAPRRKAINTQTASYAVTLADDQNTVNMNLSGAGFVYLPASLPAGFKTSVVQSGAGQITFALIAGGSLVSYTSLTKTAGQNAKVDVEVLSNSGSSPTINLSGQMA